MGRGREVAPADGEPAVTTASISKECGCVASHAAMIPPCEWPTRATGSPAGCLLPSSPPGCPRRTPCWRRRSPRSWSAGRGRPRRDSPAWSACRRCRAGRPRGAARPDRARSAPRSCRSRESPGRLRATRPRGGGPAAPRGWRARRRGRGDRGRRGARPPRARRMGRALPRGPRRPRSWRGRAAPRRVRGRAGGWCRPRSRRRARRPRWRGARGTRGGRRPSPAGRRLPTRQPSVPHGAGPPAARRRRPQRPRSRRRRAAAPPRAWTRPRGPAA